MNTQELQQRFEIIKGFCQKYRKELTAASAVIGENFIKNFDRESYIEFMNNLNDDTFTGNFLTALYQDEGISVYEKILNGEMTWKDYLDSMSLGLVSYEEFEEVLSTL